MRRAPSHTSWRKQSLSRRLLFWLLPSLVLIIVVEFSLAYRLAQQTIDEAYDRGLKSAVKALSLATKFDENGFAVDKPFQLLNYLQSNARGTVFFHVVTSDGLLEAGFTDLAFPWPKSPPLESVLLAENVYFDQHLRVAAMRRELVPANANTAAMTVDLIVAEDLAPRQAYLQQFLWRTLIRDSILLLFTALLMVFIVHRGLSPLGRWSKLIKSRSSDDLTALPVDDNLPLEARPLIEALNFHLARGQQEQAQRRRFLDNASHQIRTPLAVLKTQVAWARLQGSGLDAVAFLNRFEDQLDQTVRHAQQMLQLARAEGSDTLQLKAVAVHPLITRIVMAMQDLANARDIDMGIAVAPNMPQSVCVLADEGLLQQVLENLLDNAIRHGGAPGEITLSIARLDSDSMFPDARILFAVENSGPPVSDQVLPHLGERFYQADQTSYWSSGLGLSIVTTILTKLKSQVEFSRPKSGHGLRAAFTIPITALTEAA